MIEQFFSEMLKDSCGDPVALGSGTGKRREDRSHAYEIGEGRLGVALLFEDARKWAYARRTLLAAGCALRQDGDTEGCFAFDRSDKAQIRAVVTLAGLTRLRNKAVISPQRPIFDSKAEAA